MYKYKKILSQELREFDTVFNDAVKSKHGLLDRIMKYVVQRKGKQLRPVFVLLSAKLLGTINDKSYRAASLVELLHTATLVHDDVVDEAATRRGFFSINALWKNKIAVLVGDYLLSKGLLLSLNNGDYQILQILSTAVKEMSEGEILQLEKSRKLNLDEKVYYDIIKGKTASLLAASCAAGAASTTTDEARIADMRKFGELLGMAFQIKDDLFDYGSANVGKPTGNDIKEKKLTLPLIYTLNKVDDATKRALIYKIKNKNKDKAAIKEIIQAVVENGGIAYAEHKMEQYKQEAKATLAHQPEGEVKDALLELVEFVTNRNF